MKNTAAGRRAVTLIELSFVVSIFLLMVLILAPFANMLKGRAARVACENNLRSISVALHSYAADHGDLFPGSLKELYPNYIDNEKVFDCPVSKVKGTRDNPDYKYYAGLKESSGVKEIIVEDDGQNHKRARKNILRIDGSIGQKD